MPHCFQISAVEYALVYPIQEKIFLQTGGPNGFRRPLLIADDFQADLCAVMHEESLFLSYLGLDGSLLVRALENNTVVFRTASEKKPLMPPRLFSIFDSLLLFYAKKDAQNDFMLSVDFPLAERQALSIPEKLQKNTSVTLQETEAYLRILFCSGGDFSQYLLYPDMKLQYILPPSRDAIETLSEENQALRQMLEQAKTQYQELMDVACQYRDEAHKWYNKYLHR